MQIDISGQHVAITPAIKIYIEEKFKKLESHVNKISKIHVVLKVENNLHIAEATLHVHQQDIFAHDSKDDMYKAIDSIVAKLDRQLVKSKEKRSNRR